MNDEDRRAFCIEQAIKSNCGLDYSHDGSMITDFEKILQAAKAFEAYLKGTNNE